MKNAFSEVLQLGSDICSLLTQAGITVYPICPPVEATFPFVLYRRAGYTPANDKDCYDTEAECIFDFVVASDSYPDSLHIARLTNEAIIHLNDVSQVRLIDASEDILSEGTSTIFIQTLIYKINKDS